MTKVLHASDLHGYFKKLLDAAELIKEADVVFLTGDMLPNKRRGPAEVEVPYQADWFHGPAASMVDQFRQLVNQKPIYYVNGNHDFVDFGALLLQAGFVNIHAVNPYKVCMLGDLKVAGFANINYIQGEWMYETRYPEMEEVVDRVLSLNPDILITHAPPYSILDEDGYGVRRLSMVIQYEPDTVTFKHHFFGHCHDHGGEVFTHNGVNFYNAATKVTLRTI